MRNAHILILLCLLALPGITQAADPAPAAPSTPPAATTEPTTGRDVTYNLEIEDDRLVIKDVNLGGQVMDVRVDTGAPEIALPASFGEKLQFRSLTPRTAVDYAGTAADYPEGFFKARRLGSERETYLSASLMPDEQLDGRAIVPLSALDGPLICFLCSEGKCQLCDSDPAWSADANSGTGTAQKSYLPYWENIAGLFLGIEAGGKYYFAQIDTGSSICTATEPFVKANPQLFKAEPRTAHVTGIHGGAPSKEDIYKLAGPIKLLSIDGQGDIPLLTDVSAVPSGPPGSTQDIGSDSSPYLGLKGPAPWPVVMTIGMDLLSQYDFAFDTGQHLLILMKPAK